MTRILSVEDVAEIIKKESLNTIFKKLIKQMIDDYSNWSDFKVIPRPAFHSDDGVIEVMPISNRDFFSFKCVNGHPNNPKQNKLTVVATGQLCSMKNGYPLLISEMTILTALRTAAVSALVSDLVSPQESKTLSFIGTGAQSEFQAIAHCLVRNINTIKIFDIDDNAMDRFVSNMNKHCDINIIKCCSAEQAVKNADIISVCTAAKKKAKIILDQWINPGTHINAIGGDCPGKVELETSTLQRAKIIVEYFDQAHIEGEIQRFPKDVAKNIVHAEISELLSKAKLGREEVDDITIFDSVGIAIEDFSVLKLFYDLSRKRNYGNNINIIPHNIKDPKNLFSLVG